MGQDEFDRLVRRLEALAAARPRLYRAKVGLLAAVGYAYIFGVLAVLVALLAVLAIVAVKGRAHYSAFKAAIPLLILAGAILRALWVRLAPPKGIALGRAEAGRLLDAVEKIRRAVHGPRVDHVLLTDDFNAAVVQVPRLGIFGWYRNFLVVGLPLMHALSPAQFEAVLAHEMGHLSGSHGRFGAWIYRIRKTWYGLVDALVREERWGAFLFTRFFRWYAPYFGAYSFVLARANEYDADRCSAEYAGADAAADALVTVSVKGAFLDETYWPAIWGQAGDRPDPPFPFGEMAPALAAGPVAGAADASLERALARRTGSDDTHPSLSDRLAAIGKEARLAGPAAESAARRFFGELLDGFASRLDGDWREGIAEGWREQHARACEARKSLGELEALAGAGALPPGESMRRAALVEEVRGDTAALALYREVAAADDNCAEAQHAVGRILLGAGDDRGIAHLEKAMELDPGFIIDACDRIHAYLMARGRENDALVYFDRGERRAELLERAKAERDSVSPKDTFVPHGLGADDLDAVTRQLERYPQLRRAYLVRKDVRLFPEFPQYVLGAAIRFPWYEYVSQRRLNNLHLRIAGELEFPFPAIVINLSREGAGAFRKKMRKVAGAAIYRRGTRR